MSSPHDVISVHPAAEVFPMLDDEALAELAADIKANGLAVPVVVDKSGVLIDGRNRLKACQIAGVEPAFETYEGKDPVAYILSLNINRRHMSAGQKAMAAAKAGAFSESSLRQLEKATGVSNAMLAYASTILKFAPDLADGVLAGASIKEAYAEAQKRKEAASSAEGRMRFLKKEAPDLADSVSEERLTLGEAWAALSARKEERRKHEELRRQQRQTATRQLQDVMIMLSGMGTLKSSDDARNRAISWLDDVDLEFWVPKTGVELTDAYLVACIQMLEELRKALAARGQS